MPVKSAAQQGISQLSPLIKIEAAAFIFRRNVTLDGLAGLGQLHQRFFHQLAGDAATLQLLHDALFPVVGSGIVTHQDACIGPFVHRTQFFKPQGNVLRLFFLCTFTH